jgi:hypothetical protein
MRYDLSDHEWSVIKPMLPNKSRGIRRVDDRRVLASSGSCGQVHRGGICRTTTDPIGLAIIASFAGGGLASGIKSWKHCPSPRTPAWCLHRG